MTTTVTRLTKKDVAYILMGLAAAIFILGVVITWNNYGLAESGILGDFWGGHVGAISGMVGVLLFVATLLLQMQELELQRIELRESTKASQAQAKAALSQADALNSQLQELKSQTRITKRKDDYDKIIKLGELIRQDIRSDASRCYPLFDAAFTIIIEYTNQSVVGEPLYAQRLLKTFLGITGWPHGDVQILQVFDQCVGDFEAIADEYGDKNFNPVMKSGAENLRDSIPGVLKNLSRG